jgi:hypothetical protein
VGKHIPRTLTQECYSYWDVLTAPDEHAKLENIVHDEWIAQTGWQNRNHALFLPNKLHANTGTEGEIPVSTDSIQGGRSESLTWSSGGRRLLERVLLEVRDQTASLMLTAWWDGGYADACEGIMDEILLSYRIP